VCPYVPSLYLPGTPGSHLTPGSLFFTHSPSHSCRSPCGSVLPCSHTCSSTSCHDPQPPAVAAFERPRPPKSQLAAVAAAAAANSSSGGDTSRRPDKNSSSDPGAEQLLPPAAAAAASSSSGVVLSGCPPCVVPVVVGCLGGHYERSLPCSAAAAFSCGAACGRPLACGNHSCSKACHAVSGPAAAAGVREECEVYERACERPRSCSHPCPSKCHPGQCEPCKVECSMECHCGKTDLTFPCFEHQQINQSSSSSRAGKGAAAAGGRDPLCCGKVCGRELPLCPHTCAAQCHAGLCPASSNCSEGVTVRCSCRRLKEKWECARVLAALTAAGSSGSGGSSKLYDGSTALKLLPCDQLCAAAAKDKQQQQHGGVSSSSRDVSPARSSSTGKPAQQQQVPSSAAAAAAAGAETAAAAAAGAGKSWKKLSRAEREALAAAKEAERVKQQRQQQMRTIATYAAIMLVVAAVGVGLALGIEWLLDVLKAVDQKLVEKYSLDATPEL